MPFIRITEADAQRIRATRSSWGSRSKFQRGTQREVFKDLKRRYGIPAHLKLKVELDDHFSPDYLVLKDKRSGEALNELAATPNAQPAPSYPFPGSQRAAPAPAQGTVGGVRLGSISMDDALALLREEGDSYDSHATATRPAPSSVFVEGDRLYFVL